MVITLVTWSARDCSQQPIRGHNGCLTWSRPRGCSQSIMWPITWPISVAYRSRDWSRVVTNQSEQSKRVTWYNPGHVEVTWSRHQPITGQDLCPRLSGKWGPYYSIHTTMVVLNRNNFNRCGEEGCCYVLRQEAMRGHGEPNKGRGRLRGNTYTTGIQLTAPLKNPTKKWKRKNLTESS